MRRRTRWIIALLGTPAAILLLGWAGVTLVLPIVVQRQITAVFRQAGFENATFELRSASLWQTELAGISSGEDQRLRIGQVTIRYSPLKAIDGQVDSIQIRDGRLVVPLEDQLPDLHPGGDASPGQPMAELPVDHIAFESCVLVLARDTHAVEMPFSGSILTAPGGTLKLNLSAALADAPIAVSGTIDPPAGSAKLLAEATGVALAPLIGLLPPEDRETASQVEGSISLSATYRRSPASSRIAATVHSPQLTFAGQELAQVEVELTASDSGAIEISEAQFKWLGGQFVVEPLVVPREQKPVELILSAQGVELANVLDLLTQGRATGSGTLAGRVPVSIFDGNVMLGKGTVVSEGQGTIRLGESLATFSQILDETNPAFDQDAQMRQVKEQILEALTDFEYDSLEVKLTRPGGELLVAVHLVGQGRQGARQPLDITLNFRGFEQGLNSYLAARSSVLNIDD